MMATPDVSKSDRQSPGVPTNGVAEDMAAIFGSATKVDIPPSAQTAKQAKSSRSRSPLVGVFGVAGLATMLTVGVLVGQNTVNGEPKSAERRTFQREQTVKGRAIPQSGVTVSRRVPLKPEALEPVSTVTGPAVRAFALPIISARLITPIERTKSASGPIVVPKSEAIAVHPNQAAALVVPIRLPDCNDGSGCFQSRLYAADRDLVIAYNDAALAGVNASDLRAYRNEWLRARSLVDDRPKEALRIYGMIASDLRLFTDEASRTADGDLR